VLLALGIGTFTAAASAAPGSPLYGIHRWQEGIQAQLPQSQADRTSLHLQYANEALLALNSAAQSGDGAAYSSALATLRAESASAATALASVPPGNDHDTLAAQLDDLHHRSRDALSAALGVAQPRLSWSNRLDTTAALADLGATTPHVTFVTISRAQNDDSHSSSSPSPSGDDGGSGRDSQGHGWQVVVTGSGFASGVVVVVDGQPQGAPLSASATQVVALVADDVGARARSIGVLNPDGSAAATSAITRENDGGEDNPHPTATAPSSSMPSPTATPRSGHGGH
jgi:hypothetical protein